MLTVTRIFSVHNEVKSFPMENSYFKAAVFHCFHDISYWQIPNANIVKITFLLPVYQLLVFFCVSDFWYVQHWSVPRILLVSMIKKVFSHAMKSSTNVNSCFLLLISHSSLWLDHLDWSEDSIVLVYSLFITRLWWRLFAVVS